MGHLSFSFEQNLFPPPRRINFPVIYGTISPVLYSVHEDFHSYVTHESLHPLRVHDSIFLNGFMMNDRFEMSSDVITRLRLNVERCPETESR